MMWCILNWEKLGGGIYSDDLTHPSTKYGTPNIEKHCVYCELLQSINNTFK